MTKAIRNAIVLGAVALSLPIVSSAVGSGGGETSQYEGTNPSGGGPEYTVKFAHVKRNDGAKLIKHFSVLHMPFECDDNTAGDWFLWVKFPRAMKVRHAQFEGAADKALLYEEDADLTGEPDSTYQGKYNVSGKLKSGGKASGIFKFRFQKQDTSADCRSGKVPWEAERLPG